MRGVAFGNVKGRVVRTYNFKRGTVTDHRTGQTADLRRVLDGDMELLIASLRERPNSEEKQER